MSAKSRKSRTRKLRRFGKQRILSRGKIKSRHKLKSGRTGTSHHKKLQSMKHEAKKYGSIDRTRADACELLGKPTCNDPVDKSAQTGSRTGEHMALANGVTEET